MLFSPSSSEGPLPTSSLFLGASPVPTYADVAHGKGKATMQEEGPSSPSPAVKAEGRPIGGFMADARRAHPGRPIAA
jgi:hypothetical protein